MTATEQEKVRECLAYLQEAQALVNRAGEALCSVNGFAKEWSDLSKPYDCVKKHWYQIENRRAALMHKLARQP
jgi:hypothetical protein